ncbi:unnamed protein product [Camellia sinensis]
MIQVELIALLCKNEDDETRGAAPIVNLSSLEGVLARDGSSAEVWKLSGETTVVSQTSEASLLPRLATWKKSEDVSRHLDNPLEILGSVTSIDFKDPACLPIKDHTLTTEEVETLCDDLRVLGKQDFKHLLKWHMSIRKALSPSNKATSTTTDVEHENKDDDNKDNEDVAKKTSKSVCR